MGTAAVWTAAVLVGSYEQSIERETVFPGVQILGESVEGLDAEALAEAAGLAGERSLDRDLTLVAGESQRRVTARALGATPSPDAVVERALGHGRSSDFITNLRERELARDGRTDFVVGMRFDEARALDHLLAMAPTVDTVSLPSRLDLEAREVLPARRGTALLPYDSLSNVAVGLAAGQQEIALVTRTKPPVEDPLAPVIDQVDISVALGSFSTPYSMDPKYEDRTHNLKVGAAAIDGVVLMPGDSFSFNETVGARDAESGYRYAPGISSGQIVDVLGGGICQVASSLYGAAFFSGMELVSSRPHSRPSGYVDMGLDSTVVYPTVDLKLRNDFDFPVVLHMTVNQGRVEAEVLGPRRPFQVAFEREVEEVKPYRTVFRDDGRLRLGHQATAQRGMRGFAVKRIRKLYSAGEVVKSEDWSLNYPPTTEILRRGTNPEGEIPEAKTRAPLRDPAAKLRVVQ
jgi:hypothetical protein